jgi:ubiquinone/menaquinone biosynthesis C-methylase UbiE
MPTYQEIYAQHADRYDQLVSREDYEGHILPALQAIRPLKGLDVIELGAGTGRLSCLLAPLVKRLHMLDASLHMLDFAAQKLARAAQARRGLHNWQVQVADNRCLPVEDQVADLAISGWSLGYLVGEYPGSWRKELGKALREMARVLRPGGTIVILETLGTGHETPHPPNESLAAYYVFLEERGFSSTWIRTDYRFESLAEAEALTHFFFGDELARTLAQQCAAVGVDEEVILPECTGIWWLHLA